MERLALGSVDRAADLFRAPADRRLAGRVSFLGIIHAKFLPRNECASPMRQGWTRKIARTEVDALRSVHRYIQARLPRNGILCRRRYCEQVSQLDNIPTYVVCVSCGAAGSF